MFLRFGEYIAIASIILYYSDYAILYPAEIDLTIQAICDCSETSIFYPINLNLFNA